jgi:hypothetical protein
LRHALLPPSPVVLVHRSPSRPYIPLNESSMDDEEGVEGGGGMGIEWDGERVERNVKQKTNKTKKAFSI